MAIFFLAKYKKALHRLCIFSGENTNTTNEISLVVFFVLERTYERLPPGGRDALRKYAGSIFLAKAGSKLCLRPGPKAVAVGD